MELVFATGNPNKAREINAILGDAFQVKTLKDIGFEGDIPETQPTLEGNALQKARFVWDRYNLNCFADDTGLEIDALDGRPGVLSARYAGPAKDSNQNMSKVLAELDGNANRAARFRTSIALIIDGVETVFEGKVEGKISTTKAGTEGFGYDPIFVPDGFEISFAEMSSEAKNAISHRKRAIAKMAAWLQAKQ